MTYNKQAIDDMINASLKNEDILDDNLSHKIDVSHEQKQASYNKIVKLADKLHNIAKNIEK